jgi:hypothetical protein
MQNLPLVGDDHKMLKKRKFPNANPSCSQQDPEPIIFQQKKNLLFSEEDKRMPQKKQQFKITMTCKRFALRKWRGMREGCTVVPAMRSTALLRLPVCLHQPPQQQYKYTLNLAVKQNSELTRRRRRSSFPHKTQKTGTRESEREKTLWGKQTGLSSPGSCSRVASFRLENSRSTTMAPSSFFSNKPPPPSCFLSLAIDISLSVSSGLGLGLGGVLPAQLWIRPCRYGEKKLFLCECRRVLEASKDVL